MYKSPCIKEVSNYTRACEISQKCIPNFLKLVCTLIVFKMYNLQRLNKATAIFSFACNMCMNTLGTIKKVKKINKNFGFTATRWVSDQLTFLQLKQSLGQQSGT